MKSVFVFCLAIAAASAASVAVQDEHQSPQLWYQDFVKDVMSQKQETKITVDFNDYLDNLLKLVRIYIIKNGMDPMETEALEKGFSIKMGFINIHGEFYINHGWMQGLNSIERTGDSTIKYDNQILQLWLPLSFDTILVNYDYRIKFMNIGPSGGIEGKVRNLKLIVDIAIDMKTMEVTLQGFRIPDAGKITIRFSGHPLLDILVNAVSSLATSMLHGVVVGVVQNQVREALQAAIDALNNGLHPSVAENYLLY